MDTNVADIMIKILKLKLNCTFSLFGDKNNELYLFGINLLFVNIIKKETLYR